MMAREAASKEAANRKPRRLLAYDKSFNCGDVKIGDTALFHKGANKKGAPQRWGPAKIADIDEVWLTAKFQSQTFEVARYHE